MENLLSIGQETVNNIIFIPFNTPSLKNSKIKSTRGIFSSKTVKKYLSALGIQRYSSSKKEVVGYVKKPNLFEEIRNQFELELQNKTKPYLIGFHFVRNSKRSFDFNNANQIILDLLTAHNMIEEDSCDIVIPVPLMIKGKFYSIDKDNPGVYLKIIKY